MSLFCVRDDAGFFNYGITRESPLAANSQPHSLGWPALPDQRLVYNSGNGFSAIVETTYTYYFKNKLH